jgi:hypothetical protein
MASFLRPLLQGTVRLGGKHASPGLRLYSAQTARSNSGRAALVTGICGIAIGFGAAQFLPQTKASEIPHKPVYGTVTDFDHAIEDLKHIFSTRLGVISTDPDDLKLHGLSTNTYHTGTVPIPFGFTDGSNCSQASTTAWLCIQNLRRMWLRLSRSLTNTGCQ